MRKLLHFKTRRLQHSSLPMLPAEVWICILSFCSRDDLIMLILVNRFFAKLIQNYQLVSSQPIDFVGFPRQTKVKLAGSKRDDLLLAPLTYNTIAVTSRSQHQPISIINIFSKQKITTIDRFENRITQLLGLPKARLLIVEGNKIWIWNALMIKQFFCLTPNEKIHVVSQSQDEIVCCSGHGTVTMWCQTTFKLKRQFKLNEFSPNYTVSEILAIDDRVILLVASINSLPRILMWDGRGKQLPAPYIHARSLCQINSRTIAFCYSYNKISILDLDHLQQENFYTHAAKFTRYQYLQRLPNGRIIAIVDTVQNKTFLQIWDIESKKCIQKIVLSMHNFVIMPNQDIVILNNNTIRVLRFDPEPHPPKPAICIQSEILTTLCPELYYLIKLILFRSYFIYNDTTFTIKTQLQHQSELEAQIATANHRRLLAFACQLKLIEAQNHSDNRLQKFKSLFCALYPLVTQTELKNDYWIIFNYFHQQAQLYVQTKKTTFSVNEFNLKLYGTPKILKKHFSNKMIFSAVSGGLSGMLIGFAVGYIAGILLGGLNLGFFSGSLMLCGILASSALLGAMLGFLIVPAVMTVGLVTIGLFQMKKNYAKKVARKEKRYDPNVIRAVKDFYC